MSRAKPLSLEVKVERVLSLMQEKDDVFCLKDLERVCQKEKGVVPQSIKEVLDILISENKVKEKKVGSSKYYWSFISDIKINKETKKKKLLEENKKLKEHKTLLEEEIALMKSNRQTLPDRDEKMEKLKELRDSYKEVLAIEKEMEENNPLTIKALEKEMESLTEDIAKWAEAVYMLQSHMQSVYNMSLDDFCKMFSISMEEMENIQEYI